MKNADGLLTDLNRALDERRVAAGIALLETLEWKNAKLSQVTANPAPFLLCLAQWVDLGYKSPEFLQRFLNQVPKEFKTTLVLRDFLSLRMADAFVAMAQEDSDRAIQLLDFVLGAANDLGDDPILVLAHFWNGRAHRKKGEYESAYHHILSARQLAEHLSLTKMAAVIQIQEAWCTFQRGESKRALTLLDKAERQIKTTDDDLSLGNIHSARGRIVRRTGHYAEALVHFQEAIVIYNQRNGNHRNLARTLVNAAYIKRLLALYLHKRLEERRASSRAAGPKQSTNIKARYLEICQDALADLENAGRIYALHQHHGGAGAVLVNGGYLHLDLGDMERAEAEGAKAYELALSKHDNILMARARTLQAYAEIARVEEELGEDADIALHAHRARRYAEQAVQLALQTQNRRLLAGAQIVCGVVAASSFFKEWDEAHRCELESRALLRSDDRDHLSEELAGLKAKILQSVGVDEKLRAWSRGIVGRKTFQQVTEEFAELVIPQVWLREGKKISRVAEQLSISPKKVRRILRNVGMLSG